VPWASALSKESEGEARSDGRVDVIGGYEDYTAGKGHGVPAHGYFVTDGAGYGTLCH